MNAIVQFLLMAVQQLLPLIVKDPAAASSIVQTLINVVPLIIQEASDLVPMVQSIIKALSGAGVSADDMAALTELDKQCDDAFDAAVAAKGI